MAKRVQFTENDLKTIRKILSESLVKMQEKELLTNGDVATTAEKSAVIIPLIKIDQMLDILHITKKEAK
jgi:hypothetical protein